MEINFKNKMIVKKLIAQGDTKYVIYVYIFFSKPYIIYGCIP